MKTVRKRAWWSGFGCGVATATLFGAWIGHHTVAASSAPAVFDRAAFHQALDAVLDRYVEPVDGPTLLADGLKHIVAGLDSHSHFLTADERKALRVRAQGGVSGLTVHLKSEQDKDRIVEITGVLPRSPAAKAGLSTGDHILEIDGHSTARALSQVEVEGWLSGAPRDVRVLTVQRKHDAAPATLDLELTASSHAAVEGELIAVVGSDGRTRNAARICIRAFRAGVGQRFKATLARLQRTAGAGGLAAVVLDLRGNPGGEVDEALIVADLFVADGILTRTRGRGGTILREERAHAAGTDADTPLVIVQDRHTASAAELLTAALRDNARAKSVGERSYGKGTVQEVLGLPDGSVLTLTIARYFSPNDQVIDGVGLTPDVVLPSADRARPISAALRTLSLTRVRS